MPRTKKAVTTPAKQVEKKITISKEQIEELRNVYGVIGDIREMADDLGTENDPSMMEIGFTVGKMYTKLDAIEDQLDDLLEAIDPYVYTFDDEDDDNN